MRVYVVMGPNDTVEGVCATEEVAEKFSQEYLGGIGFILEHEVVTEVPGEKDG